MRKLTGAFFGLVLLQAVLPLCRPADFEELEKVALAELEATDTPGAAIAIVRDNRVVFAKGFGVSSIEADDPVTPDMLFRLGSTTKMFTAAALVSLAKEGKFRLDRPIGFYVKGLSPALGNVTGHQLLTHTAGLYDEAPMYGLHDDSALVNTIRSWNDDRFFTTPGRIYSYSNPGYWLAGFLIEALTGKPFADVMKERLFQPLGMTRTTFRPTMAMTYPLSQGHEVKEKNDPRVVRPAADNAASWPAGSMFSCVDDLARFAIAFLSGERLPREVIVRLSTPYLDVPGTSAKYGYGLRIEPYRGVRLLSHAGSRLGFGSLIRLVPSHGVAVVLLTNKSGGTLNKTAEKAMELILPLAPAPAPRPKPELAMSEAEMNRYAGVYSQGPSRAELFVKAGKLMLKEEASEVPVTKVGENRFSVHRSEAAQPQEFLLIPDATGEPEFLHRSGRALARQR